MLSKAVWLPESTRITPTARRDRAPLDGPGYHQMPSPIAEEVSPSFLDGEEMSQKGS